MAFPEPIFILASPRSFTSLVCAMLGQHPEAYAVPEINLFVTETLRQLVEHSRPKRGFMLHGLLRTIAQLYSGEQTIESIHLARRWMHRRQDHSTAEIYQELCERVAPLRIVDKSPAYSKNLKVLGYIRKTFPNAHYLYLTRHPREQGKSVMKAPQAIATLVAADSIDYSSDRPIIDPQYAWYRRQRKILDFLDTIPAEQKMQIQGENVCNEPRQYLEKICQWLNFSWSESIYAAMLRTQDSSYACMGPYGAQWGNNPGFQTSPAFRYRRIPLSQLSGPLPWRSDDQGFIPEVLTVAQELGYS
ncbi:MAG: sulfotransferase [Cyanobacteria bacterium J06639_14]